MSSKVPYIFLDTAAFAPHERFPQWSMAVPAYDVSQPAGAGPFAAKVDVWTLGEVVITSGTMDAVRFDRSVEKARIDGTDRYSFLLVTNGHWRGDAGGPVLEVGPGDLCALDLTRPMMLDGVAGHTITIQVPRAQIEARLRQVPDVHGRLLDDPLGRLLNDHFIALVRQLPHVEQSDAATLANATLGLIASCFDALPEKQTSTAARREVASRDRIKRYIDQHLAAPDLSPARICEELGLSRPTLYRAFASERGIAAYIRERRLQTIHDLLTQSSERRKISAIAYEFGFASDAHFSRVFHERYGYTPGELRSQKAVMFRRLADAVRKHPVIDTYLMWMKEDRL